MVNKRKKRTTRYKKFHKATEAETEKKKQQACIWKTRTHYSSIL